MTLLVELVVVFVVNFAMVKVVLKGVEEQFMYSQTGFTLSVLGGTKPVYACIQISHYRRGLHNAFAFYMAHTRLPNNQLS